MAERREIEQRNRQERFDRCVAQGAAFLASDPAACRVYALFLTVLFPEVGVVNAVTDRQRFGRISNETLDHLVRLVVAVYRNPGSPTVAAETGKWILPHADESYRFLHRCAYLLVHDAVATVETRRELLRSFLLNLPPPPPAATEVPVPAASRSR